MSAASFSNSSLVGSRDGPDAFFPALFQCVVPEGLFSHFRNGKVVTDNISMTRAGVVGSAADVHSWGPSLTPSLCF